MIDLMGRRRFYFIFSLIVTIGGLAILFIPPGLRWGIEFSSGTTATVSLPEGTQRADVEEALGQGGLPSASVQGLGGSDFFLRLPSSQDVSGQQQAIRTALEARFGPLSTNPEFYAVGPALAREQVRDGTIAVLASVVGILGYVALAFRSVQGAFRYGVTAIVALVHDIVMVFAVSSILIKFGVAIELNTLFLIGVLTTLGYSVNDTIVVFDRIRENVQRRTARDFPSVVNFSILETAARSLNTGFGTLLAIFALLFIGPV
ncbi:MAG: protein translocase subunit SecF, partial [Chloroflexi bacterium]|nr:protein translocase subunit SecF [Chloroflexota bacterium]